MLICASKTLEKDGELIKKSNAETKILFVLIKSPSWKSGCGKKVKPFILMLSYKDECFNEE